MTLKYFSICLAVVSILLLVNSITYAQITVEEVFESYKTAVKNRQYFTMDKYATSESIQKGYHIMNDFFRDNFLKCFDNNPYSIRYTGMNEAIIYFKEDRNGTANPHIFTKENGKWKVDFVKMKARIVFGEGNKWRWR